MTLAKDWLLFVGPAKTGTSWVDRVLRPLDGVCLPYEVKETQFFDRYFDKGIEWYLKRFRGLPSDLMVEVAPTYFFSKEAPERIRETIPHARIVVSLRDPVRRAVSQYLAMRRYGSTDLDIEQALHRFNNITRYSMYAARLEHWISTFGKSQVRVIFYEEVVGDVERLFGEVLPGVRVKPRKVAALGRVNAAAMPRWHSLARFGQRATRALRKADWNAIINVGKMLGLKDILYAGGTMPDQRDLEAALSGWGPAFREDREALSRLIGRNPPWAE